MIDLCLFINLIGYIVLVLALMISINELESVSNEINNHQKTHVRNIGLYMSIIGFTLEVIAIIMAILIRCNVI